MSILTLSDVKLPIEKSETELVKIAERKLINELQVGTTIFEVGTLENGNHYFDGAGDEPWFQAQFLFDSVTIQWDAFRKPAWYEERPFKT